MSDWETFDNTADQMSPETSADQITPTDRGRLPEDTRRVLVQLLRGPYVSQVSHGKSWSVLLRSEADLREHLNDLFLDLIVDTVSGVAFIRNMQDAEQGLPKVVRSQRLTLVDTAIVLFLREQLLRAEAVGGRVFVGRDDIIDHVSVFRSVDLLDEAAFARRVRASIDKMKDQSVLLKTPEDDRFEISPILRLVFDADQVIAVTQHLRRLVADGGQIGPEPEDDDELEAIS